MTQPDDSALLELAEVGESLKERLSTLIDVAGVLAIAAGIGWGLFPVVGPYAVAIGGVIVIVLNLVAGLLRRPPALPEVPVSPAPPGRPAPGPTDPGNLHVSGV
jgi:hypothetical protein